MAHYAFLDENNIVTEVIVGKDEGEDGVDWEKHYSNFKGQVCKRTSYNTHQNEHRFGGQPFRKNYAGIGFTYREDLDAFIPPQDWPSWILDEEKGCWNPPIPMPEAIEGYSYAWNETTVSWDMIEIPPGNIDTQGNID